MGSSLAKMSLYDLIEAACDYTAEGKGGPSPEGGNELTANTKKGENVQFPQQ